MYIYTHTHIYISILFHILSPLRLLYNIEYNSLCYVVDPSQLSILYIVVCILEKAMAPHSSTLAWENPMDGGAWQAAVHGVVKSQTQVSDFTFTFHFHALEQEMATHSSVLAWRIPGTGEPFGLPSMGSHRVRQD